MDQSGQNNNNSLQNVDPMVSSPYNLTQAGMGDRMTGANQSGQMSAMTEQVIATDLLMAAKSAIKNYAIAISECATPELRQALTEQLNDTIRSHEQITNYMINKGYYHPVDVLEQLRLDQQAAKTALNLQ
ncbi:spore coat protein [Robertmurraya sp. GLU-23]